MSDHSFERLVERLQLETRLDDFSYQVSSAADQRFWFRLERQGQRGDVITDFFIGTLSPSDAAAALLACYQVLRLVPCPPLVFRNIVPRQASPSDSDRQWDELNAARELLATCGRELLSRSGYQRIRDRLERRRDGFDLLIDVVKE